MTLLLGVPDRLIKENEVTTWETNKIGGLPNWFQEDTPTPCCMNCQREMILVTQIYCPLADSPYHRCLHVFVCLRNACSSQNRGWRVIRTQLLDETAVDQEIPALAEDTWTSQQDDWGVGQDDWGDDDDDHDVDETRQTDEKHNPSSKAAQTLEDRLSEMSMSSEVSSISHSMGRQSPISLNLEQNFPQNAETENEVEMEEKSPTDSEDWRSTCSDVELSEQVQAEGVALDEDDMQRMMGLLASARGSGKNVSESDNKVTESAEKILLPAYYLNVFAEGDAEDAMSDHVSRLLHEYQQREGQQLDELIEDSRKGGCGAEVEKYDKTEVKHGDKLAYKFIKRLQACPQQCIRYQWSGSALLMTQHKGATVNKCEGCQNGRVFELQLVPPLIPFLTLHHQTEPVAEFGTVLVYTCADSCWQPSDTWREEVVVLQHDPDQHRFT